MERSVKGFITSLVFKAKLRPHKYKKARYAIGNIIKKELSKIIREFEKLPYEIYEKKIPTHEPTDSYFYPIRKLSECMMRADAFNSRVYPVRTKPTDLSPHVYCTFKDKSKRIIVHKTLLQSSSTDKDESKRIIVQETLSQSCFME